MPKHDCPPSTFPRWPALTTKPCLNTTITCIYIIASGEKDYKDTDFTALFVQFQLALTLGLIDFAIWLLSFPEAVGDKEGIWLSFYVRVAYLCLYACTHE